MEEEFIQFMQHGGGRSLIAVPARFGDSSPDVLTAPFSASDHLTSPSAVFLRAGTLLYPPQSPPTLRTSSTLSAFSCLHYSIFMKTLPRSNSCCHHNIIDPFYR